MSILTLESKKKERRKISNQRKKREGKFPIKEKAKKEKKGNSQSKSGRKQKEKKGNSQSKNGRKKKERRRRKGRKFPIKENKRNMQKGLWTRQYLNNTELSPSK